MVCEACRSEEGVVRITDLDRNGIHSRLVCKDCASSQVRNPVDIRLLNSIGASIPINQAVSRFRESGASISDLISGMGDQDWIVRYAAAALLAEMEHDAREAEPTLIKAMSDENDRVRDKVLWTLFAIGSKSVPTFIQALEDPLPNLRMKAVKILGYLGDRSVIGVLKELLNDEDNDFQWEVKQAIKRLNEK